MTTHPTETELSELKRAAEAYRIAHLAIKKIPLKERETTVKGRKLLLALFRARDKLHDASCPDAILSLISALEAARQEAAEAVSAARKWEAYFRYFDRDWKTLRDYYIETEQANNRKGEHKSAKLAAHVVEMMDSLTVERYERNRTAIEAAVGTGEK